MFAAFTLLHLLLLWKRKPYIYVCTRENLKRTVKKKNMKKEKHWENTIKKRKDMYVVQVMRRKYERKSLSYPNIYFSVDLYSSFVLYSLFYLSNFFFYLRWILRRRLLRMLFSKTLSIDTFLNFTGYIWNKQLNQIN